MKKEAGKLDSEDDSDGNKSCHEVTIGYQLGKSRRHDIPVYSYMLFYNT